MRRMCDKHGQEAVDDNMEFNDDLYRFEEAYCGEWDSEEDFARHIVSECYGLERTMGGLSRYFDYEAYGRELFMYDCEMGKHGNVFRKDKSGEKLAESEEDLLEHHTDGTDAFDTLYIGCEKFPYHDSFSLSASGVL